MTRNIALLAGSFATCLLCGTAFGIAPARAAQAPATATQAMPMPSTPPHVTRVERRDFTRLSKDGQMAFGDITLARLAIFDGKTEEAATLVDNAQSSFDRAAADNTAFMKAEADMQSPKNMPADRKAADDGTPVGDRTNPVAWIPVDQQFVLSETLVPTPRTTAALASANAHLKAGETEQAKRVLRVASVAAVDTIALAPLDASTADIHRASQLMAAHDYYAASQSLRMAVDGVRFDTIDVVAPVHKGKAMAHQVASNDGSVATADTK